jgi:hypothetical protein
MDLPGIEPGGATLFLVRACRGVSCMGAVMATHAGPRQRTRIPCRPRLDRLVVDVAGGWLASISNGLREGLWLLQVETSRMGVRNEGGDLENT